MTIEGPARMTVLDHGVEDGIQWVTAEAPLYGAVNGYVKIPAGHHWHGKSYDEIDVRVHGGLTYGGGPSGWIGFDCLHSGDWWPGQHRFEAGLNFTDTEWDAGMVAAEAKALARKVAAADYTSANLSGSCFEYDDEDGA